MALNSPRLVTIIAMASAVAALVADGPSDIAGARNSVAISLPEYWTLSESVAE